LGTNRIQDSYWKGGQHGMGKPYSDDLRERVVGAAQDGATIPETAEQLGVSISSVVRFRRLHRETGGVSYKGICSGGARGPLSFATQTSSSHLPLLRPSGRARSGRSRIFPFPLNGVQFARTKSEALGPA
jgi:transposase-like protein